MDQVFPAWLSTHGHGPMIQAMLIIVGTFILEDAATILAAMDVQVGQLGVKLGLGSLYVGIVLGDIGLYALGMLAARVRWAARWVPQERLRAGQLWLHDHVVRTVFISRFIPGARLPTYTACGFLGAGLGRFTLTAIIATLIWTSLLFSVSLHVGRVLTDYLGAWRWVGMIGFALTIVLMTRIVARMRVPA